MRHLIEKYYNIFFRIFNNEKNWICYEIVPVYVDGVWRPPCIYDNCKLRFYNSTGSIDPSQCFLYKPIDIEKNTTINMLNETNHNTNRNTNNTFDASVKIYVVLVNNNSDIFMYNEAKLCLNNQISYYSQHPELEATREQIKIHIRTLLKTNKMINYDLSPNEFSFLAFKYGINVMQKDTNNFYPHLLHIDIDPDLSHTNDCTPCTDFHFDFLASFINVFICNNLASSYSNWSQI